MIKQIIHVSDIHLKTYQLHDLFRTQLTKFIDSVTEKMVGYEHDEIRIVLTGDIVDQKINVSNEQFVLLSWFFYELTKIGGLIVLTGNHDFLINNQERVDSLSPIIDLLNKGQRNSNGKEYIKYLKDRGVVEDENVKWVVYSLYEDNIRPEFVKEDGLYVGLFHGQIQGMSTDLGFSFDDGYDKLNFLDLDLVLCGDIHKRQVFETPNKRKGYMIGSLIQLEHGETIKHHGYGIYDVEEDEYSFVDIESDQPFMHFKITDIKDIEDGKEVLLNLG